MSATLGSSTPISPRRWPVDQVVASAWFATAMGALATVVWSLGEDAAPQRIAILGGFAVGVAIALPAIIALIVRTRCPALLLGCGAGLVPRLFASFSPLFFPLLWPALVFVVRSGKACGARHGFARHAFANVALLVAGLLPIVALLVVRNPVEYETEGGGQAYSSDVITAWEAWISLGLSGLTLVLAVVLSRPGGRRTRADVPYRTESWP